MRRAANAWGVHCDKVVRDILVVPFVQVAWASRGKWELIACDQSRCRRSDERLNQRFGAGVSMTRIIPTAKGDAPDDSRDPPEPAEASMSTHTGGCLCGAVRFTITAEPYEIDYCHCTSYRKHTGAPVSAFLDCLREDVEFSGAALAKFESSPGVLAALRALRIDAHQRVGPLRRRDPHPRRRDGPPAKVPTPRQSSVP